jgi:branched-chain amino acid transport system ATP-binding protein
MSQLKITSMRSGYGHVQIINDVSLDIQTGEIVAIIGRNGVGKTTLMKSIIGNLRVSSGAVEFLSRDVTALTSNKRARLGIGYVPQGRGIFTRLSVEANLKLGLGVGNALEPNFARVFDFFPILKKRLSQLAGSMSGGEQQQLAIARILIGSPHIILLDEPSEGIQPNIVKDIGKTIRRLQESEKMTIMMVEQNLDLIRNVADRCLVMDKGTIVASILPQELDDPETARRYLAIG